VVATFRTRIGKGQPGFRDHRLGYPAIVPRCSPAQHVPRSQPGRGGTERENCVAVLCCELLVDSVGHAQLRASSKCYSHGLTLAPPITTLCTSNTQARA
jgi:hypothetical protein